MIDQILAVHLIRGVYCVDSEGSPLSFKESPLFGMFFQPFARAGSLLLESLDRRTSRPLLSTSSPTTAFFKLHPVIAIEQRTIDLL